MSKPSPSPRTSPAWNERPQGWFAAIVSILVHALFVLLLLWSSRPLVTTPQGTSSAGRVKVDFVGEPAQPVPPVPPRQVVKQQPRVPVPPSPLREQMDEDRLLVPEEPEAADTPSVVQAPPAPSERPPAPVTNPSEPAQRRPERWTGRPPGFIDEDMSPVGTSRTRGTSSERGNGRDMHPGQPSMDVGGYQVVYDLLGETRLREWMEAGMKEISIPLPGTHYRMVCPAEVALKRESSKCRLLEPGDPEMAAIGDAREVITVMAVYHRGERVWRGPGPYR